MNKLYICGITQNKKEQIQKIIDISYDYVDGFVWTDHYSNDGTYELLENNKKEGKIYQQEYSQDHDFSANRWLRSGHIKEGDWCFILDSSDLPNKVFLRDLKENTKYWDKNNIGMVYGDRPWLIKYYSTVFVFGSPHWGVNGSLCNVVCLEKINGYRKENYIFNDRDLLQSGFLHPARYWYEFGRSNQCQLLYLQYGNETYQKHENLRIMFRQFCRKELKLEYTLDSLTNYMIGNVGKYPTFFENILEIETNMKDLFRLYVLKQELTHLINNRFDWSYYKWKKTGQIDQKKEDGFISLWHQYKVGAGLPVE